MKSDLARLGAALLCASFAQLSVAAESSSRSIYIFGCEVSVPETFTPRFSTGLGALNVTLSDPSAAVEGRGSIAVHAYGKADDNPSLGKYYDVERDAVETLNNLQVTKYVATHVASKRQTPLTVVTNHMLTMVLYGDVAEKWKDMIGKCAPEK